MAEMIDFGDLAPRSRDFRYRGQRYVLFEASAAAGMQYRSAKERASRYEGGKFVGVDGLADAGPILVAACTFRVDDRGGAANESVGLDVVKPWPDHMVERLYDEVRELSPHLDAPETLDSVRRQIARLREVEQVLLLKEKAAAGGKLPPNVPAPPTGGTSDNAGSMDAPSTS
jgi:hypothetical protein